MDLDNFSYWVTSFLSIFIIEKLRLAPILILLSLDCLYWANSLTQLPLSLHICVDWCCFESRFVLNWREHLTSAMLSFTWSLFFMFWRSQSVLFINRPICILLFFPLAIYLNFNWPPKVCLSVIQDDIYFWFLKDFFSFFLLLFFNFKLWARQFLIHLIQLQLLVALIIQQNVSVVVSHFFAD